MENKREIKEKILRPANGILMLFVLIIVMIVSCMGIPKGIYTAVERSLAGGILIFICSLVVFVSSCIGFGGLKTVKPNEALVLSLFGKYHGTIYEAGFYLVNPFCQAIYPQKRDEDAMQKQSETMKSAQNTTVVRASRKVSTKLCTFANGNQKVNDKLGNPVDVSAIVVWKVVNATKAVVNIDNYLDYLSNQTDSTIRNVARLYPYDLMSDDDDINADADELTLRGSASKIADQMKDELAERVVDAGIEIVDIRLNQIAYSTEIAAAMLQKQQAVAIIAARKKIVEGAVSMVEMALDQLKKDGVVDLDEERKAAMVSNLLVVLCGSKEANPVVNTGSIY